MEFLKKYYTSTIKYDLINKFNYKVLQNLPMLKEIILHFSFSKSDLKLLSICSLGLEFISGQKVRLTRAKNSNLLLKIRKGTPIGCKVTLKKRFMYLFLNRLILEVFPKLKLVDYITYKDGSTNTTAISFKIKNVLVFSEFESNYYIFNKITDLQIIFLISAKTKNELIYLLNCFKIPFLMKYS